MARMSQLAFKRPLLDGETRTPDQVVEHYEIEVELADRLREHAPELPVLFVSGYTDDVILDRGVDQQGANFLPKPFSAAGLAAKLDLILGGEQQGSRAS